MGGGKGCEGKANYWPGIDAAAVSYVGLGKRNGDFYRSSRSALTSPGDVFAGLNQNSQLAAARLLFFSPRDTCHCESNTVAIHTTRYTRCR